MVTISSFLQNAIGRCTAPDNVLCGSDQQQRSTQILVSHRADRPIRCIIDPHEVVKMIKHQANELARQEQALQINDSSDTPPLQSISKDCLDDSDMMDVESSFNGTQFSYAAKTDITTATGATRVAANRDRYSPPVYQKNRSKAEHFRANERMKETLSRIGAKQNMYYDDDSINNSIVAESDRSVRQKNLPAKVQIHDGLCGIVFAVCAADEFGALRREYCRALHLKMKARMGPFFFGPYLKHCPDSTAPNSLNLDRSQTSLSPSSADDDSSAALNVNYGDLVHSYPIHMMVDDSDFMDLGITGSLGLVKCFEVNLSGQRLKSPNHYKVLLNRRSGIPLAVCALKSPYGSPVVRIYATKQRVFGQKPVATTKRLGLVWCDSYPLYAWAEFSAQGEFPNQVVYSMYMSSGSDGCFEKEPSYRAFHPTVGSPEIVVMGRTENERERQGCALISLQTFGCADQQHFAVSISRGIDPALILCFASIVDETMENAMRQRLKHIKGETKFFGGGPNLTRLKRPGHY